MYSAILTPRFINSTHTCALSSHFAGFDCFFVNWNRNVWLISGMSFGNFYLRWWQIRCSVRRITIIRINLVCREFRCFLWPKIRYHKFTNNYKILSSTALSRWWICFCFCWRSRCWCFEFNSLLYYIKIFNLLSNSWWQFTGKRQLNSKNKATLLF